jgi:hypothetical protein
MFINPKNKGLYTEKQFSGSSKQLYFEDILRANAIVGIYNYRFLQILAKN